MGKPPVRGEGGSARLPTRQGAGWNNGRRCPCPMGRRPTKEKTPMDKINFKSILKFLLLAFIIYAVFSSPAKSADVVRAVGDVLRNAVTNLREFFDALLGKN